MILLDALEFIMEKVSIAFLTGIYHVLIVCRIPINRLQLAKILALTQSWFIFTMIFLLNYNGMWRYVPLELTHGIGTAASLYHLNKFPGFFGGYQTWGRIRCWRLGIPALVSVLSLLSYRYLIGLGTHESKGLIARLVDKRPSAEEIEMFLESYCFNLKNELYNKTRSLKVNTSVKVTYVD